MWRPGGSVFEDFWWLHDFQASALVFLLLFSLSLGPGASPPGARTPTSQEPQLLPPFPTLPTLFPFPSLLRDGIYGVHLGKRLPVEPNNPQNEPTRCSLPLGDAAAPYPFPTSFPASCHPWRGSRVLPRVPESSLPTPRLQRLLFHPAFLVPQGLQHDRHHTQQIWGALPLPVLIVHVEKLRSGLGESAERLGTGSPGLPPHHAYTDSPVFLHREGVSHLILTSTQSKMSSKKIGLSCSSSFDR